MVNFSAVVQQTRNAFISGKSRDVAFRKKQLLALINMLDKESEGFCQALYKDLHKHKHESLNMEINLTKNDAILAYNELDDWMKPEKAKKNLLTISDDVYIHRDPLGVTLIIGAWNYPVQLVLLPLIGAIAAGNCAVIKPSEVSPATAEFMAEVVPKYLDTECYHVITGGIPETTALLAERWDLIFYTGNNVVAKIVYEAAAKHLTPVILELGGKSPVFVDESSDMAIVARRITWGKFVNTGQTCIAPDYVMCTPQVQEKLLSHMKSVLSSFYGDNAQNSDSLGRIVNERHYSRIKSLIGDSTVALGGQSDDSEKYIEPTVLRDVKQSDPSMKDEIFGPLLPIMTVKNEDEAIEFINQKEKPLAMYIFSKNKQQVEKIIRNTSSGGVTVNDTIMHASLPSLPFGGVGHSGTGSYHGKFSFDAFSHKRGVMARPQGMEKVNDLRCPPYTEKKSNLIAWVMSKKIKSGGGSIFSSIFGFVKLVVFGVFIGFLAKQAGLDKYLPESLK